MAKFVKGQSGNPGGKPKALRDIEETARAQSPKVIAMLTEIVISKRAPAASRVAAGVALLDRGWGKPRQMHDVQVRADLPAILEDLRLAGAVARANEADGS